MAITSVYKNLDHTTPHAFSPPKKVRPKMWRSKGRGWAPPKDPPVTLETVVAAVWDPPSYTLT